MTESELRDFYHRYFTTLDAHEIDKMDQFIADRVMLNGEWGTRSDVVADMRSIVDAVPDFHWDLTLAPESPSHRPPIPLSPTPRCRIDHESRPEYKPIFSAERLSFQTVLTMSPGHTFQ